MKYFKNKKILILILILVITSMFFVFNKSNAYHELPKVRIKDSINNGGLAIMVEDAYESNKFKNYEGNTFPTEGYTINAEKSGCVDSNGKTIDALVYNEDKTVSIKTKQSVYCYLYYNRNIFLGSGTKDNPYQISVIEDLMRLSNTVINGESYTGKFFELTRNLDFQEKDSYEDSERTDFGDINGVNETETLINELTNQEGSGFIPIGNATIKFQGNFDGKEKRVDNLYIYNLVIGTIHLGLFGDVSNGTIANLTTSGKIFSETLTDNVGGISLGGISGEASNEIIDNCHNEVEIISTAGSGCVGGIIGTARSGKVEIYNSSNDNNGDKKISGGNNTGGIVGYINTNVEIIIEKCHNNGKIENTIGSNAGGLAGRDYETHTSKVIIIDSYNNGEVTVGRDSGSVAAGLMAISYGTLNIINSNNLKSINNLNNTKTTDVAVDVGGLLGIKNGGNGIILNSYNIGDITGGNRTGGIVGFNANNGKLIISNTYNSGIITANTTTPGYALVGGGIVGYNNASVSYIINSYNTAEINSLSIASGIIGHNNTNATCKIINSYNVGNITGKATSAGITNGGSANSNVYINNSYNLGEITGNNRFGLGSFSASKEIINSYFNNKITGSNDSSLNTKYGMNETAMKNQTFVNTLNSNLNSINLTTINPELEGYILQKWKLGSNGYPILDGEFITDLSGNNHNGISYAVSHNEEGVTTSIDSNHLGYIDAGLSDYDFGNSFSVIIRVKFNALPNTGASNLIGNLENGGIGLVIIPENGEFLFVDAIYTDKYYSFTKTYNFNTVDWHTIVFTYDGLLESDNLKLYIDGELHDKVNVKGNIKKPQNKEPLVIGGNPSKLTVNQYSYTTFKDTLIFDRALTEEQDHINTNYKDDINVTNKDELLLWYKF